MAIDLLAVSSHGLFQSGAGGSCDYPSEDDVRDGVTFSTFTGNLTLPPAGDVVDGVQYGTNGTEFTGTFTCGGGGSVTGGGDAGAIADALIAAVMAVNLVAAANVVRRKTPSLPQGTDPPQIVVSVSEEGAFEPLTATKDLVKYPAAVCIITAGGQKMADDTTLRAWRQALWLAINQRSTFASVTTFNQVNPAGKTPYSAPALPANLNHSLLLFEVELIQARSG